MTRLDIQAYKANLAMEIYKDDHSLNKAYRDSGFDVQEGFIRFNVDTLAQDKTANRFEDNLKELCALLPDGKFRNGDIPVYLRDFYNEFVAKAFKELGCNKLKALSYERKKIEKELLFNSVEAQEQIGTCLEERICIGKCYTTSQLKLIVDDVFEECGVGRKATKTYINNFYILKRRRTIIDDEQRDHYEIIAKK